MQPIKLPVLLLGALLCLSPAFAAAVPEAAYTGDIDQLLAEGWVQTTPDVYQRTVDGHELTLAYGDAGPRLELGWLEEQIEMLAESFLESGNSEVALTLRELERRRDALVETAARKDTRRQIGGLDFYYTNEPVIDEGGGGGGGGGCSRNFSIAADALPTTSGPRAVASTSHSDSCSRSGSIYCYAFARAYSGSVYTDGTQADGPRTVYGSGSCSVAKTVYGDNNCFANSTSQVQFVDDTGRSAIFFDRDSTSYCAPLAVAITTGRNRSISVPRGQCVSLNSAAGSNRSDTAFQWRFNGSANGNGASVAQTFCNNYSTSGGFVVTHTMDVTGTSSIDSDGDGSVIDVYYEGGGGGGGCPVIYLGIDGLCAEP